MFGQNVVSTRYHVWLLKTQPFDQTYHKSFSVPVASQCNELHSYRQETDCRRLTRSKEGQCNIWHSWLREIAPGTLDRSTRFCPPRRIISLRAASASQPSAKCRPIPRLQRCAVQRRVRRRTRKEERAPIGIRVFWEEKVFGTWEDRQTGRETDSDGRESRFCTGPLFPPASSEFRKLCKD